MTLICSLGASRFSANSASAMVVLLEQRWVTLAHALWLHAVQGT